MSTVATPPMPVAAPAPNVQIPQPVLPAPGDEYFRLSVDQYHAMIQAGILTDDDPVELLEGLLVQKMPRNPEHRFSKRSLTKLLTAMLPPGWEVFCEDPLTTSDSEPEPDICVIRGTDRDYIRKHPSPADTILTAEVANTSVHRDRGRKKRIYARAGVPVYWIVNLVDQQIEVYTDPTGPAEEPDYRQRQDYKPGDSIPVVLDGSEVGRVNVSNVLP